MDPAVTREEILATLDEEYYFLAATGASAIAAVWDDWSAGRLDAVLRGWDVDEEEFSAAFNQWAAALADNGLMLVPAYQCCRGDEMPPPEMPPFRHRQ